MIESTSAPLARDLIAKTDLDAAAREPKPLDPKHTPTGDLVSAEPRVNNFELHPPTELSAADALNALESIAAAPPEAWAAAHRPLDPDRVHRLLGLVA